MWPQQLPLSSPGLSSHSREATLPPPPPSWSLWRYLMIRGQAPSLRLCCWWNEEAWQWPVPPSAGPHLPGWRQHRWRNLEDTIIRLLWYTNKWYGAKTNNLSAINTYLTIFREIVCYKDMYLSCAPPFFFLSESSMIRLRLVFYLKNIRLRPVSLA